MTMQHLRINDGRRCAVIQVASVRRGWGMLLHRAQLLTVTLFFSLLLGACASPTRLPAVPDEEQDVAVVDGMADIRYWPQTDLSLFKQDAIESYKREAALALAPGSNGPLQPANFLAISGGGENGAFGAGLLVGWTEAGTRPEFKLVTGVSTGALIAPFAFLGPKYDGELKALYTNISTKDVLEKRGMLAFFFDDAVSDTAPLKRLVERYVTADMLKEIAAENAKGRILLIGTTNIDAHQGILWNIGKIAAYGSPQALELVRKILVASAAIPIAFPPVMIDVEVNGVHYQEMHVDGGASAQVFAYPPGLRVAEMSTEAGIMRVRKLYVIRNARLDPEWKDTERQALAIGERAVSALVQNQGIGDLYRIYATAQRDGLDFNLAFIPPSFNAPLHEPFDKHYMNELFKLGYDLARSGYPWVKTPPGY